MVAVISNEDSYGECGTFCFPFIVSLCYLHTIPTFYLQGYYLATLEAAVAHIIDMASQYEGIAVSDGFYDDGEDIFDYGDN